MLPRLTLAAAFVIAGGLCCGLPETGLDPNTPPAGQPRYVVSASTLKLRASPSTAAATLAEVPRGATVIVTGASTGSEVASNIRGGWAPVWYAGQSGYAFDGFLLPVPPPPVDCPNLSAWALAIGFAGPETVIAKQACSTMGVEMEGDCDTTKRTPLNGQAWLETNAGYEWGSDTIHIPNTSSDAVWAAARQCMKTELDFSNEGLPTASGPSPTLHTDDGEVSMLVAEGMRGWEYPLGCSSYVHVTQMGTDVEVAAGGGC